MLQTSAAQPVDPAPVVFVCAEEIAMLIQVTPLEEGSQAEHRVKKGVAGCQLFCQKKAIKSKPAVLL